MLYISNQQDIVSQIHFHLKKKYVYWYMPSEVKFQCTSSKLSELKNITQNPVCNFQEECQFKYLKYSLIFTIIKKKKFAGTIPHAF